jgi:hypothetical protein
MPKRMKQKELKQEQERMKKVPPPISITGLIISSFEQRGEGHL